MLFGRTCATIGKEGFRRLIMTPKFLDYSQFDTFMACELKWWERYRQEYQREPKTGQNNDARTLGSLVHEGLDAFRTTGTPTIANASIIKYRPSPECLSEATLLLNGYIATYPTELFTRYYCEEPLRFPLHTQMDGLAKIDSYFNIGEPITIPTGLGSSFTLEPGWWIHEYKTKAASKDVGKYIGSWRMNMQAAFQMMALEAMVGERPKGVLVNVLEKAPEYKPVRTCKSCKERSELRDWIPAADGYRCPQCDNVQDLDTKDNSKVARVPKYYRIMVQRSMAELERSRIDMVTVAQRMVEIDAGADPLRRTNSCVDQIWGQCEYYGPHSEGLSAAQYNGFVKVESLHYVK